MKKVKNGLGFVFVLITLVSFLFLMASAETTQEGFTYRIISGQVTITGYEGTETELVIPDEIDGYEVTKIDKYAFWEEYKLKSISLPKNLKDIGDMAFDNCRSLTKINIPDTVTRIGSRAFNECIGLTGSLVIPESVTSIGNSAFNDCSGLTGDLIIPEGVVSIGQAAFQNCENIEIISLPSTLESLGDNVFDFINNVKEIKVNPENKYFRNDEYGALYDIQNNTLYYFPNKECVSYSIEAGTTKIASCAFSNCNKLVSVTVPESVISIERFAFENCTSLVNINIPEKVTRILHYTFSNCSSLKSITIPDGVTYIESYMFKDCTSLENVILSANATEIASSSFENCVSLKNIIIPDKVNTIFYSAFNNCSNLETIVIPNSVVSIRSGAFKNCSSLKHVAYKGSAEEWDTLSKNLDMLYEDILIEVPYLHLNFNIETDITEKLIPSTCQTQGTKATVCSCGYTYSTETLSLAECVFTAYESNNNATCTADGTKTAYCNYGCGATDTILDEGSALSHNLGDFVVTKEATCTVNGEESAACSRCDYIETRLLIANNHKDENLDGYCDDCNEFIADENCICVCHAKTIGALVYKLFMLLDRIFDIDLLGKVFNISRICGCGIAHY